MIFPSMGGRYPWGECNIYVVGVELPYQKESFIVSKYTVVVPSSEGRKWGYVVRLQSRMQLI